MGFGFAGVLCELAGAKDLLAHALRDFALDIDFRLMRRAALQRIDLVSTSGVVCTEMIYKLKRTGARFIETPVHHYPRLHGASQFFTLRRVAQTAFDFFGLWLRMVVLPRVSFGLLGQRQPVTKRVA